MLYRLSYFRELTTTSATVIGGSRWIRTTEGENQQIYSLPHLAALEYSQYLFQCPFFGASCRIRTNDPEITNHVLWPTELKRRVFYRFFATPFYTSAEKRCKGTTFFSTDQIFFKKNAFLPSFFIKRGAFSPLLLQNSSILFIFAFLQLLLNRL